jgi:hypothetical protein
MYTIYEIAQHVITDKPYEGKSVLPAEKGYQGSVAYTLLKGETNPEVLQKVRDFVSGKLSEDMIEINKDSAYQYLAAAKVVDFDTIPAAMAKSTYKIREMAILHSAPEKDGRGEINMLNAFSMPPLHKENLDALLVNELDGSHPIVKKAAFGDERDGHLKRIYTYCQKESEIVPELVPVIEEVVRERFQTMMKIAEFLPKETTVIYKGCSGAGKSFALKQFTEKHIVGIDTETAVQSTDNVKNDIRRRTKNIYTDQHVHLLGFSTFKMLSEVMKENYPKLSTIQEGWLNSTIAVNGLFKDLKSADLKLDMHDFDGDYEALCLRVLARYQDKNSPKPPLDQVERGFKTSRESREQLLKSLRETDLYQFRFVHANGMIDENLNPKSLSSDPASVNQEIAATKKLVITAQHAEVFGGYLNLFVGMTIEAAFEKAKNAKVV